MEQAVRSRVGSVGSLRECGVDASLTRVLQYATVVGGKGSEQHTMVVTPEKRRGVDARIKNAIVAMANPQAFACNVQPQGLAVMRAHNSLHRTHHKSCLPTTDELNRASGSKNLNSTQIARNRVR